MAATKKLLAQTNKFLHGGPSLARVAARLPGDFKTLPKLWSSNGF